VVLTRLRTDTSPDHSLVHSLVINLSKIGVSSLACSRLSHQAAGHTYRSKILDSGPRPARRYPGTLMYLGLHVGCHL
jgi:hypothetical protein